MSFRLAISKDGYNALTELDNNNYVFHSDYNTFKYYTSGTMQVTLNTSTPFTTEYTVNHNLGFIPLFFVLSDTGAAFSPLRYYMMSYSFADFFGYFRIFVYATTTQLIFRIESSGVDPAGVTVNFSYKIFKNDLNI